MASLQHDTNYIQNVAGCTPGCERTEYSAKLFKMSHDPSMTGKCGIAVFFAKDMFPVKEHFYVYDGGSLFADVGGYLGLLLGYSLFGFYDTLMDLVEVVAGKCNKHEKVESSIK